MKRVVITGAGPVSPIGIGREPFTAAVREGRSGIGPVASFDAAAYPDARAAEIRDFRVDDYLESRKNYLDRASELAFAALSLALEDANLDPKAPDCATAALLLGTAYGNAGTMGLFFDDFLKKGPRLVKPVLFPHTYSNTTISMLAIEYGLAGHHLSFASGAISASLALVEAFDRIRGGHEVLAFAGGFESFNEIRLAGCGPGRVPGEGAAFLVLEEREHALARGASILGEVAGAGVAGGGRGQAAAEAALAQAGLAMSDVKTVLSSGSLEPFVGDTQGASGALLAVAALASLGKGAALVNAADPGGGCVSLVLRGAA